MVTHSQMAFLRLVQDKNGKKLFDPRDDTTAWSDNPALCVRDYLTNSDYGLGEAAANIDDDQVEIAADVCDYKDYDVE